ncbi:MAG: FAD-dependent oxidoreductase [Actinobacteria bacterium]|uniref:Cholesterol oxidase n=1 Tax=freshwater metagenome TaxID=449393 RepID=A0A6J6MUR8_9ZZZZ|nr:FAD-dependent oxidoreductase [Actinomycetota bacterium]
MFKSKAGHDFDVVIIGSGFGGSVAALRLTEKGYKVGVLEAGRRFSDKDFPKTSWRLSKFLYMPRLGLRGIQRIHILPDVLVLAGAGVGGGSLVYANTLYKPPASYFNDKQWNQITDWDDELSPWYDQASRMLGVASNPYFSPSDEAMKQVADQMGVGHTFKMAPLGVYFGDGSGVKSKDPFFGGVGPDRDGCLQCGSCMTGCRHNAKNTLPKNYLGLAEKAGAKVFPEHTVIKSEQLSDGSWQVTARKSSAWFGGVRKFTAAQVVVAAGTYNTQKLMHKMKSDGTLPKISDALGKLSRTNSEALTGTIMPRGGVDYSKGSAITSSFFPDDHTHVEPVRYGKGSNFMGLLQTVMTDGTNIKKRRQQWFKQIITKPSLLLKIMDVRQWSERTVVALIMQNVDSSLTVKGKRGLFGWRLTSENDSDTPNATYIPAANEVARRIAENKGGIAGGHIGDLVNAPFTAHFVGGCVIGATASEGVIDPYHRVWNYPTMHIVDGASVTANLGVNPSLTITAQAERAFSMWPNKGEADPRPVQNSKYERVSAVAPIKPFVPKGAVGELRLS